MFFIISLVQLFATFLAASGVTYDKPQICVNKPYSEINRIYGGENARPGEFPHQVSLQMRYFNSHVCGGTLIADRWILIAAHCFRRSQSPWTWQVKLGEYSLKTSSPQEVIIPVKKIFVHERYDSKVQTDDITLLQLERPVALEGAESHIKPICLPPADFSIRTGWNCVASGWGKSEKGQIVTDILQKIKQPLLDHQKCAKAWKGIGWPISDKQLCLGDLKAEVGVCSGDSGGPVQCSLPNGEWMQVGVTSWTTNTCTHPGFAAVFTKVSSYLNWIQKTIARHS